MQHNHLNRLLALSITALAIPLLSGCDIYNLFNRSDNSLSPSSSLHVNDFEGYYQTTGSSPCTFHDIGKLNESPYLPSKGNVKVLVVPVEFSDYPFSSETLDDIASLTSGSAESTKYWESLSSFYSKSSYGALNLSFVQTDVLNVGTISNFVKNAETKGGVSEYDSAPEYAMAEAVRKYKSTNGNTSTKELDSDNDGYIDATIMIYSAPDMNNNDALERYGNLFWAYCYAPTQEVDHPNYSPVGYRYFWASYDFFYTGTTNAFGRHTGVDAHTLIHETGHLLGADDYYNMNAQGGETNEPSGALMMMCYNVGDHDMFTKLCYDWVHPYCPTGDCTISIKPSQENGDCIVLADSWNGTGFDEYLLIDYVTPTGLNKLDAETVYPEYVGHLTETSFKKPGIRVFHIDNRLVYGIGYDSNGVFQAQGLVSDKDIQNFSSYNPVVTYQGQKAYGFAVPGVSNCAIYDCSLFQKKGFELISMIQRGGRYTWSEGGAATSADLFQQGDTFTMEKYKAFFPNKTLNNGKSLGFSFTIDSLTSDQAVISFKKA
ncbi:MAG: hypothetical protein K6B65_02465 [Bacilli bacterium]|nr:hypothetical protein [Bacilli bacterium]